MNDTRARTTVEKRLALAALVCLTLSGCVTAPLRTERLRESLAEDIGYKPSEMRLMGHCFFEEVQQRESSEKLKGVRGVVAVTDSELCLFDGALPVSPTRHFHRIPFAEIEGVSGSDEQVEIKHKGKRYALVVFNWKDFRPNYYLNKEIHEILIAANAPEFESSATYRWSRLSSSRALRPGSNQQDYPQTNLEASLGAHQARENQILERQNRPFQ